MPVSTRSQGIINNQPQNDSNQDQRNNPRTDQEEYLMAHQMRNPHHGLKEKMKALTLLYEQQKLASAAFKNPPVPKNEEPRFSTHPSIDLINSARRDEKEEKGTKPICNVMRENVMPSSTVTWTYVMPPPSMVEEAKENVALGGGSGGGGERIVGFSCPRKARLSSTVARKLSMGGSVVPQSEPRVTKKEIAQDLETISEKRSNSAAAGTSRILVFVRLRPMNKKEKEAGSRCCVKIVNKRDVFLTEFATENDYLRLKRLRGRHFTFDSSFPDSTTQQEVYSTT